MPSFLTPTPPLLPASPSLLELHPENSLGIEDVRSIQSFLSRKPLNSSKAVVVVHSAEKLTIPAQNALLKILEEPPEFADIYLVTTQPDSLLTTIESRCLTLKQPTPSLKSDAKMQNLIVSFLSAPALSSQLNLLDQLATSRDTMLNFLDQFELYLHTHASLVSPSLYDCLVSAKQYLNANCSPRLTLINFVSKSQAILSTSEPFSPNQP